MLENLAVTKARICQIESRFANEPPRGVVSIAPHTAIQALVPTEGVKAFFPDYLIEAAKEAAPEAPANSGELDALIEGAAAKYGVEPDLVRAVVRAESGFNPAAVSPAGARGLMQLMPGTAQAMGVSDAFDPGQNVDAGVRYLKQQIDRFGDVRLALAAYNAGPNAVAKYGGVPPYRETRDYVNRVLSYRAVYGRDGS